MNNINPLDVLNELGVPTENLTRREVSLRTYDVTEEHIEIADAEEITDESTLSSNIAVTGESDIVAIEEDDVLQVYVPNTEEIIQGLQEDFDGTVGVVIPSPEELAPTEEQALQQNIVDMSVESVSRFSGADWFKDVSESKIILAGVGGIGSWTALLLSRLRPDRIALYDSDIVESANMSGQLYSRLDVGLFKVNAIAETINKYSSYNSVYSITQKFTPTTMAGDIMICGFDNMEARKTFFMSWVDYVYTLPIPERNKCLFIDGRLNMEEFQIFCIRGDDTVNMKRYQEEFLFNDDEAEAVQCSRKQTSHCAAMISSYIVNLFTNYLVTKNQTGMAKSRELPFKIYYNASAMYLNTEY